MSFLDDLKKEAAKLTTLDAKRAQIEALREKAQTAFKAQFLLDATNKEKIAFLKGRLDAFDECIQLFMSDEEKAKEQDQWKWEEEEN
jgi:hypothetical protein